MRRFEPSRAQLASAACVPDSNGVVTADLSGLVRLLDYQTGAVVTVLADLGDYTRAVAVSPNGKRIAVGCDDGGVRLYDRHSGGLVATWFHPAWIVGLAFVDDHTLAAGVSAGGWRLLALRDGEASARR